MQHAKLKPFPKSFFWGASTSAYQVEGAWDNRITSYNVCYTKLLR